MCIRDRPYVDVLLGIEPYHLWKDDNDHSKGDWKDGVPLQPSYEQQDEIFQHFIARYPNLKCIARHVRYAHSGSENSLKAFMWYDGHTFEKMCIRDRGSNDHGRTGTQVRSAQGGGVQLVHTLKHGHLTVHLHHCAHLAQLVHIAEAVIPHALGDGGGSLCHAEQHTRCV